MSRLAGIPLSALDMVPQRAGGTTAVLIGQIAAATRRLRVGAGGIMLPNHAPLVVADEGLTMLPTGCAPVKSWPDCARARAVPNQAWPHRDQPQACCECSFELN
jgi:hypothetical protein